MFSNVFLWIGRLARVEKYRQKKEKSKEMERAEAARKKRQMENFRKQCFMVHICEKEEKKAVLRAS